MLIKMLGKEDHLQLASNSRVDASKCSASSRPHLPRLHMNGMIETSWSRTKPVWTNLDQPGLGDGAVVHDDFVNHSGRGKICFVHQRKKKFEDSWKKKSFSKREAFPRLPSIFLCQRSSRPVLAGT